MFFFTRIRVFIQIPIQLGSALLFIVTFLNCNVLTPLFLSTSMNSEDKIHAVILDLDGTLVDTENATKGVLREFLAKYGKQLDKEREGKKRLGMTLQESAAAIVKDYDLPLTPNQFIHEIMPLYRQKWSKARALPGANRLIKHLYRNGVPLALASNSLTEYIDAKIFHHQGWSKYFTAILGSDQVKIGKPSPDLFIEASRKLGTDSANCLVIEDSLVGVKAGKAAKMKVVAVPSKSEADCSMLADSVLHSLLEFQPGLWGLPPFDDWVDSALPIEPIYLGDPCRNGSDSDITDDDGKWGSPCQVVGVYFGWAECGFHRILKVVVGIGWDCCSVSAGRNVKICIIDENVDKVCDEQMQVVLVGYIRGLNSKEIESMDVEILEEDKSIAISSLDQPIFTHKCCIPI